MNTFRVFGLVALSCLTFACASRQEISDVPPVLESDTEIQYEIGVGDVLDINVWRNPELSLSVPVRPDGKISIPLVGDVQASGESASSLSESLRSNLVNFIRNPQVTVIVAETISADFNRRVRVTGAVENPISVAYRDGMTVLDLVLDAGGLNEFALANRAKLYRKGAEGVTAFEIRLGDILNKGKLETNYELAPSDIITIPERTL